MAGLHLSQGCRDKDNLSLLVLCSHRRKHLPYLIAEAMVKHSVCLIQHNIPAFPY